LTIGLHRLYNLPKDATILMLAGSAMQDHYLHYEFDASAGDQVEVALDHAANVQLLDPANYQNYRGGRAYRYHGGYVTRSPYRLPFPRAGHWHLVIDLGGQAGTVKASAALIRSSAGVAS